MIDRDESFGPSASFRDDTNLELEMASAFGWDEPLCDDELDEMERASREARRLDRRAERERRILARAQRIAAEEKSEQALAAISG